jgi:hypothetical protein
MSQTKTRKLMLTWLETKHNVTVLWHNIMQFFLPYLLFRSGFILNCVRIISSWSNWLNMFKDNLDNQ